MGSTPPIRTAAAGDAPAISALLEQAFLGTEEARLVTRLEGAHEIAIALVAQAADRLCGYVAFSPVTLEHAAAPLLALAPIAVAPSLQRQGVGSALMRAGLEACRQRGTKAVVLLGSPVFYRRFGFVRAAERGLSCEPHYPEQYFQALILDAGWRGHGLVRYSRLFDGV